MKLSEFPFFSSELIQFTCDDLTSDWQTGEAVSIQAHGEDYLIRQGNSSMERAVTSYCVGWQRT